MSSEPVATKVLFAAPAPDQPATKDPELKSKAYCHGVTNECPYEQLCGCGIPTQPCEHEKQNYHVCLIPTGGCLDCGSQWVTQVFCPCEGTGCNDTMIQVHCEP